MELCLPEIASSIKGIYERSTNTSFKNEMMDLLNSYGDYPDPNDSMEGKLIFLMKKSIAAKHPDLRLS
jgi:hypothetical protein